MAHCFEMLQKTNKLDLGEENRYDDDYQKNFAAMVTFSSEPIYKWIMSEIHLTQLLMIPFPSIVGVSIGVTATEWRYKEKYHNLISKLWLSGQWTVKLTQNLNLTHVTDRILSSRLDLAKSRPHQSGITAEDT